MTFQSWKRLLLLHIPRRFFRFNGAMTFQSWKLENSFYDFAFKLASMEP